MAAKPAAPNEPVINCFMRAILFGRIAPVQTAPDREGAAADDPAHLHLGKPNLISHGSASSCRPVNQLTHPDATKSLGPEPKCLLNSRNRTVIRFTAFAAKLCKPPAFIPRRVFGVVLGWIVCPKTDRNSSSPHEVFSISVRPAQSLKCLKSSHLFGLWP